MPIKVKELKDDAIIEIKVNKAFYLMVKAILLNLINNITVEDKDTYIKESMTKEYKDLDETQRSFYTTGLLLAEIEKVAKDNNLYQEKEILQPGDEGYVEPKLG
jgi:SepF-like predicted cell division protein (DUF552 family)